MTQHIAFLLTPGFPLMSYASVVEPLRAANLLSGQVLFKWSHIAPDSLRVQSSSGSFVDCEHCVGDLPAFDLVLVLAGGRPETFDHAPTRAYLRKVARSGVRLGGVSGGPVILAKAGVMAGRHMTVHWEHAASLLETHPDLMLSRALFVIDRDRVTCAGGVAPLDMMHALIAETEGTELATQVSDWFLHTDIRPAGSAQRAGIATRYDIRNPTLLSALKLMEATIAEPMQRADIAAWLGISDRQLGRIMQAETGHSVSAMYRDLRLTRARHLILQTALPLTEIAYACGFSSPAHFSTAYKKWAGVSPSEAI